MAEHKNRPDEENSPEESAEVSQWRDRVETLRALVDLARETKLSELELEQDGIRLSLKSPAAAKSKIQYTGAVPAVAAADAGPVADETFDDSDDDDTQETPAEDAGLVPVVSPMVGIFYRAASPNDPNFVEIGDHVEIGQTLGLVETMKVFNEITSEIEGTIVAVKVANMALVETGDVLLTVRKS